MAAGGRRARRRALFTRTRMLSLTGVSVLCVGAVVVTAVGGHGASCAPALAPVAAAAGEEATNYVLAAGTDGNCSLSAPADDLFVALPPPEYAAGAACGSYLEVTGPRGSVRVKVIDQCPECGAGHIDMSQAAFSRIGVLSQGIIPVTYQTVVDPSLPGPLTVRVKEGSSQYWLALRLDNHGNALTRVQVTGPSGGAHVLTPTDYGYWLAASGAGPGPFRVQATDDQGHTVTLPNIVLSPGTVQSTTVMMYGAAAAPAPAPASASAAASRSATPSPDASPTPTVLSASRSPIQPGSASASHSAAAVAGCRNG
jgi:expansin (peptidoglycan-binding protein)